MAKRPKPKDLADGTRVGRAAPPTWLHFLAEALMDTLVAPEPEAVKYETDWPVLYDVQGAVAWIRLNRPSYHNAQNAQMIYALDDAFEKAARDDAVKVVVLGAEGRNFSSGHDIGTPGRDSRHSAERRRTLWYDHANKPGAERPYAREQELYLGLCQRWRDLPKPTIAMVQGACIAGGLMLAWVCDLIVASDDAFFQDPVLRMGIPGVEYFAHAYELPPRVAKEFLMLGEKMSAERAYNLGMVNRIVPRGELEGAVRSMAEVLATHPRLALALAKQAINHVENLAGKRSAIDAVFHMHHFAHAQNNVVSGDLIGGHDAKSMAQDLRKRS
jgi:enoyl-CoA hydratase